MLHRHALRADLVLDVLALLAVSGAREGREEARKRALRPRLHPRQRRAARVLDRPAHVFLEEPVLVRVAAAEEKRCGRRLRPPAELLPEASEGGDPRAGADHDDRDVALGQAEVRGPLLREHLVAGLEPRGDPSRARAVEAAAGCQGRLLAVGQAARAAELLDNVVCAWDLLAREAHANGDALRRGLGRGRDGELAGLLPGAVDEELVQVQVLDPQQRPELVHLAIERLCVERSQRVVILQELGDVIARRIVFQLGLQRHQCLFGWWAVEVAVPGQGLAERARGREGLLHLGVAVAGGCERDRPLQVGLLEAQQGQHRGDVRRVVLRQHRQGAPQGVAAEVPGRRNLDLRGGRALGGVRLLAQLVHFQHRRMIGLEIEAGEHIGWFAWNLRWEF
mmetsp:Transcript_35547/g.99878  ORF Transcript_35547/g.99878 Transcript_35547/m.99878 type:complete len:394 (-) Transcript_35547:543-1724(-)